MNEHQLRRLFPNASAATLAANAQGAGPVAVVERPARNAALGKGQAQADHPDRFLVRVTSIRKRLLDADNLCEKYHVDCCRYAGLIPGDAPHQIEIQTTQRKAQKGEQEATLIEIYSANAAH